MRQALAAPPTTPYKHSIVGLSFVTLPTRLESRLRGKKKKKRKLYSSFTSVNFPQQLPGRLSIRDYFTGSLPGTEPPRAGVTQGEFARPL